MSRRYTAWLDRPWSVGQAVLYGTLTVGVLDGLAAIIMSGLRGTRPGRLFQSIAFALVGQTSRHAARPGPFPAGRPGR